MAVYEREVLTMNEGEGCLIKREAGLDRKS